MKITTILEAGTPVYHKPDVGERTDRILEHILKVAPKAYAAYKNNPELTIYRGINDGAVDSDVFQQDTRASVRSSENTANFVTLATTFLPSWSDVPARSSGVSCTNQVSMAASYGAPYVALPFDDATVVYTGADDFWNSLPNIPKMMGEHDNVEDVNRQLNGLYEAMQHLGVPPNVATDANDLWKFFRMIDKMAEGGRMDHLKILERFRISDVFLESDHAHFETFFSELVAPVNARVTDGSALLQPKESEEIFISGEILFVRLGTWRRL